MLRFYHKKPCPDLFAQLSNGKLLLWPPQEAMANQDARASAARVMSSRRRNDCSNLLPWMLAHIGSHQWHAGPERLVSSVQNPASRSYLNRRKLHIDLTKWTLSLLPRIYTLQLRKIDATVLVCYLSREEKYKGKKTDLIFGKRKGKMCIQKGTTFIYHDNLSHQKCSKLDARIMQAKGSPTQGDREIFRTGTQKCTKDYSPTQGTFPCKRVPGLWVTDFAFTSMGT